MANQSQHTQRIALDYIHGDHPPVDISSYIAALQMEGSTQRLLGHNHSKRHRRRHPLGT